MALEPEYIICPVCTIVKLRPDPFLVRCSERSYILSRNVFGTVRQIRALPEAAECTLEEDDRSAMP